MSKGYLELAEMQTPWQKCMGLLQTRGAENEK